MAQQCSQEGKVKSRTFGSCVSSRQTLSMGLVYLPLYNVNIYRSHGSCGDKQTSKLSQTPISGVKAPKEVFVFARVLRRVIIGLVLTLMHVHKVFFNFIPIYCNLFLVCLIVMEASRMILFSRFRNNQEQEWHLWTSCRDIGQQTCQDGIATIGSFSEQLACIKQHASQGHVLQFFHLQSIVTYLLVDAVLLMHQ